MENKKNNVSKNILPVSNFKKGDLVKFCTVSDDSDYATNLFGVEPHLNWFVTSVYVEEIYGEIVKKNTIEVIYKDGRKSNVFYKIVNGVVLSELKELLIKKRQYNLKLSDIFRDKKIRLKDFKKIELVKFIPLGFKSIYKNCLLEPPKKNKEVSIWNKSGSIGYKSEDNAFYENGEWFDSKTKLISTKINTETIWEIYPKKIYIDGKIFIEDKGL